MATMYMSNRGLSKHWQFSLLCLFLCVLSLVFSLACGPMPPVEPGEPGATATPTPTAEPIPSPQPVETPLTALIPPTPIATLEPVLLPTATATPTATPLPTPTPAIVPTATPMPMEPVVRRVIFALNALGREYSVMRHGNQVDSMQYRPEYEHLVGMDPVTGAFMPELATDWELLPDGNSFRFRLREGVQFHRDWGAFTVRDVVHSHQQLVREDSAHPKAQHWRGLVTGVEAEGDYAVVFRMDRPVADFLSIVGEQQSLLPIQSSAHFEAEGEPQSAESLFIAGTGPYQMVERQLGSRILFERPPETHWRVMPDFAEFEFRFIPDPSTRLATLSTGEAHLAVLPLDQQQEASMQGMRAARSSGPTMGIWMHLSCCWVDPVTGAYPARPESPLTNATVRRALAKAINRTEINEFYFNGKAEIMHLAHWHPTRLGWNPSWETDFPEQYGYDPAAAIELLAQAGYNENNPLETAVEFGDLDNLDENGFVGEAISSYFSDADARVSLVFRIPTARREHQLAMEDDNIMAIAASNADQLTSFAEWHTPIHSPINANNHPAMTQKMSEILRTPDIERQSVLWRELGDLFYNAYLALPLFWFHADAMYDPEVVEGYSFLGSMPGTWTHVHTIRAAR